ncbi:MAG: hydroxyacid dehydrogenase [Candidatus Hodarchaeales archaeon]
MKVLIADSISPTAVAELNENFEVVEQHYSPEELLSEISKYHAVIVRSATKVTLDVIEAGTKLKVIGRAGVGVDNIDVDAATKNGIYVVNSPRASTISVAEMTIALILALGRRVVQANIKTKKGEWPKKEFMGIELFDKKLGFVGCGRIGSEVAVRALAFGMKPMIYDPYLPPELFLKFGADEITDLDVLFEKSDFITIHALLNDETRGMVSTRQFDLMKPSAYLVNCARGGIVDEEALYVALKERKIAGAALDVFTVEPAKDTKLFELENLYVSPHVAASTKEAQERAGSITAEQVRLVLTGEEPEFCVNAPDLKKE